MSSPSDNIDSNNDRTTTTTTTTTTIMINKNTNNNSNDESSPSNSPSTPHISISSFIKSNKSKLSISNNSNYLSIGTRGTLKSSTGDDSDSNNNSNNTLLIKKEEVKEKEQDTSKNEHIIEVKWRDQYGFVVDFFIPELKKFEAQESEKIQEKLTKWTEFIDQNKNVGLSSNPKQLVKLLSRGIPHQSRESLWKIYSGSFEKQRKEELELYKQQKEEKKNRFGTIRGLNPPTVRKSYYKYLLHIIKTSNHKSGRFQSIPEIDKDIARTFPGHPYFDSDEGKRKLSRVLQAYSIRNRKVGYCQSMNIVAGFLLYVMNRNEEDTFWLLSTLVEDYCTNYYSTNLMGSQVDMATFDELVKTYLPSIYQHFNNYDVSLPLLSAKWFMCLFVGVLPTEIVFRIWDHMFFECGIYGYNKPPTEDLWLNDGGGGNSSTKCNGLASYNLLVTGLSILSYFEQVILNCHSTPHLLVILSNHVKGLFNSKEFFKKYYQFRSIIDQDEFITTKEKCEIEFITELEKMRKLRDLTNSAKVTRFSKNDLEKIWIGFRSLEFTSRYSMGKSMILDFKMFEKVFQYILPNNNNSLNNSNNNNNSNSNQDNNNNNNNRDLIIKQLFKAFDKNKDGTLDFTELMSGLCVLAKGTSEERLQLYFSFFDENNSGFVSKNEMKLMLQNVYDKIDMDPLAVTQYTVDQYVDMVFENYSIVENDKLSFDMFRQAIIAHPKIFRCFMIEEETFSIEDFELQNQDSSSSSNGIIGANNSSFRKKSTSRIKFQEALTRENELIKNEKVINNNNINNNIDNNNNNIKVEQPKTSTLTSNTLIEAIEMAKKEQASGAQSSSSSLHFINNNNSNSNNNEGSSSSNNGSSTTIYVPASSNSSNNNNNNNNNASSSNNHTNQEFQGNPLSCCKFM